MPRLPIPGSDDGDWGNILNSYLEVSLASDGTLNSNVVGTNQIQANAVTNTQLDSPTQAAIASIAGKYTKPSGGIPASDLDSSTQTILTSVTGKYVKPGGGIPYTDLAGNIPSSSLSSAVQTSLGLANTSIQPSTTLSGGDLSGTISSPTLSKIQGVSVSTPAGGSSAYLNASGTWTTPSGGGGGLTLDTTVSDIKPDTITGTAVAGNTGMAADAGHQHTLVSHDHSTSSKGGNLPVTSLSTTGTASSSTYLNGAGAWATPGGSGNMNTSTYDPAGIAQQVVGISATQTLTNKSISGSQITSAVANATNAVSATSATTATTANTVTTIPALTGDVTSSGSSNATTVAKIQGTSISAPTGGSTNYLNATGGWTTPSGGGGGSGTQAYNLGSMSSNVTLQNPSTYGMQYGILTANTAITLPSASAGESFLVILTQDSTGSRIPSFVGSNAKYPAGNPVWVEGANGINVLEIQCWDGTNWEIFPATSDVAPLNGIYLKLGDTSGVFPSTSSPSTPSFRLVGATSSGAPTTGTFAVGDVALDLTGYWWFCTTAGTPGSWTQMSSGGGGSVSITSPDSSITVGGTSSAPTLEAGPSVVKISSPATYSRPGYNGTSWVAENPRLVDITAEFSVSTSSSDNTLAINTALYTLGQKGIMGFLPPGTYKCATVGYVNSSGVPCASNASGAVATGSVITIGNGSLVAPSSWTGGLVGSFPSNGIYKASQASQQWPAINESVIKWTGGNNASVSNLNAFFLMQGPINGWKLENLVIDGNSSYSNGPYVGLAVVGSRFGRATDVVIKNVVNGLVLQALNLDDPNDGANGNNWQANTYQNTFERVQILYQGGSAATNSNMITAPWAGGWKAYANYGLTITSNGGPSNSCYNNFKECQIIPPASGGATNYGLCLQGCDSNRFEHLVVSSNTGQTYSIAMDYTNSSDGGEWPAGNVISGLELGGQTNAVKNIGGPANSSGSPTAGYNRFENISSVNGFTPNPLLGGLIWGGEFPVGFITLGNGNGTATLNSSSSGYLGSIFNLLVTTTYAPTTYVQSIETWIAQPGGTPGFVYATINYSGANPQNVTFTSSSSADTSVIGFRLVTT
jgi:hypothetical protein